VSASIQQYASETHERKKREFCFTFSESISTDVGIHSAGTGQNNANLALRTFKRSLDFDLCGSCKI
jgi:hypothetical protein